MTKAFEYCEFVGVSVVSVEEAVQNAVEAAKQKCAVSWFEIGSLRGRLTPEGSIEYQVTVKFGCK